MSDKRKRSHRRLRRFAAAATIGVALATTAVAGAGASPAGPNASSPASKEMRLSGSAGGNLPAAFGQWAGDAVAFDIEARGTTGTFDVSHRKPDGGFVAAFNGDITCLAVGGDVAVATGVITEGSADIPGQGVTDLTGKKVAFTVLDDGRRDRFFWQWEFLGAPINDCQGTAPVWDPSWGGFRVSGEML
ncbi:hypothetical protein [Phytomonospora endophytica]|uniref:Uncharacterized protein n=1 Tax=Phytomonospora endophytica TaxID=714109 RepID=A0A841FQY2_9ACTN|nr:hypothetical protein [Phytomonospora endophytica]MBB6036198.1 hypothetical protein [Phytomonospora endophytica]GIG67104.1 hypothetical protein Pen01_33990 [Phytomonospora endophytica]